MKFCRVWFTLKDVKTNYDSVALASDVAIGFSFTVHAS